MLDFTGVAAIELQRAGAAERELNAERSTWVRKLRDLRRQERGQARRARAESKRAALRGPLTGAHSPWI